MKKLTLLVFLASTLFICCDDNDKVELMWYTDVDPDESTTSMIPFPWTINALKENSIISAAPTGHNSIVSFAQALRGYDFDGGFIDFDFQIYHAFSGDEAFPTHAGIIIGSKKDHIVSLSDKTKHYVKKYSYGDVFDYGSFETNSEDPSAAYLIKHDTADSLDSDGEFYIAVQKIIKGKPHYGWLRVEVESASLTLTVKEYALCRNADQEITIGQRN